MEKGAGVMWGEATEVSVIYWAEEDCRYLQNGKAHSSSLFSGQVNCIRFVKDTRM